MRCLQLDLTADDMYISVINAIFFKAPKWGLTSTVQIDSDLIQIADNKLLQTPLHVKHCLHSILPPVRDSFGRTSSKRRGLELFDALGSN